MANNYRYWSASEIRRFIRLYPKTRIKDLVKEFPGRTRASLAVKALSLGLFSAKLWQSRENTILKKSFGHFSKKELTELLPRRSWKAIIAQGERLGLKRETAKPRLKVDESYFEKWTPNMAYILGFIIADGCIVQGTYKGYSDALKLGVQLKDIDILEKIKSELKADHKISEVHNAAHLSIASQKIVNDLKKLSVSYRKSLNEQIPIIPGAHIRNFIRGIVDGDGSLWLDKRNYPTLSIAGGKNTLEFIQRHFFTKFKLYSTLSRSTFSEKAESYLYQISYRSNSAKRLIDYLYNNSNIYLDRKYIIALKCANTKIKVRKNNSYRLKRYHESYTS